MALVALLAVPLTIWNLATLWEQHRADLDTERVTLGLLSASAALDGALTAMHGRIASGLQQAALGKLDEAGRQRLHDEAGDVLRGVDRQLDKLLRAASANSLDPRELQLIAESFAAYRRAIAKATDFPLRAPPLARTDLQDTQDTFLVFAGHKAALSAKLVAHTRQVGERGGASFDVVLVRTVLVGSVGLIVMLLAALIASQWVSRRFIKISDAMLALASNQQAPPELPEIERIYLHGKGVFRELARAALIFRNTLVERQHTEAQLQKLSLAVEQNPNSVIITSTNGTIEFVNQGFIDATGYSLAEVVGQNPRILQSGKTPKEAFAAMWSTVAAGETWRGEFINRRKSGEEYVERTLVSPIRQPDGRVTHYLAIKEDITEQRRLEAELNRYRNHLEEQVAERTRQLQLANERLSETEFAMDRSGIAIHWVDADSGQFLNVNSCACEWLGYTREEMLKMSVSDINPEIPCAEYGERTRLMRELGFGRIESVNRAKDGRFFPIELTYYYQEPTAGRGGRFITFITDITQRKEIELSLAAAKEAAEAANRAKSDFLANMSHEIRTPMNAIIGLTHLCLCTELDTRQRDYLDKVARAASSLLGIINDILDFSKIEAGMLEMETIPFAVAEVLENLTSLFAIKIRQKGLALHVEIGADVPEVLLGDPLRLGQVLSNLVGNAVKFTERGELRVRADIQETTTDEVVLRFSVRDTGIGMSAEEVAQIFQPFTQADASITRKYGGTGLGLSISRRLVNLMGGDISIDSTRGQGTDFSFTARYHRTSSPRVPFHHPLEHAHDLRGARLLLVEDQDINRQVAHDLLVRAGITVIMAGNGREAIERLGEEAFDGVLMDMQMPVMDGITAARAIRLNEQFKNLPIIAITASAMNGDREECLAAGMNDHITKPIDGELMLATLSKWIAPAYPATVAFRAALLPSEAAAEAPLDRGALTALMGEARHLLQAFNTDAEIPLEKLCAGLETTAWAAKGAYIKALASRYDYDRALDALRMLAVDMGATPEA